MRLGYSHSRPHSSASVDGLGRTLVFWTTARDCQYPNCTRACSPTFAKQTRALPGRRDPPCALSPVPCNLKACNKTTSVTSASSPTSTTAVHLRRPPPRGHWHQPGASMSPARLLKRIARGDLHNVRFADVVGLAEALGFTQLRVAGSHHIFVHPDIPELINLQEVKGQAKAYQLRQLLRLIERYNLELKD